MSSSIIDSRVSVNAIINANKKRINRRHIATDNNRINGEIHVKFSTGLTTKEVIITKEQISSAYRKALHQNGKKV